MSRAICYNCYRPSSNCICKHINTIETNTRFVILMHPKEYRKTKNGTGHFTNLSLPNCELFVGIDFSQNRKIEAILKDPNNLCYTLYPSKSAININHQNIAKAEKNLVIFLIDSTWPCSRAMLRESPNIDALPKVSFTHNKSSAFKFKEQPKEYCLSTIESTQCLLELLHHHGIENIENSSLKKFLLPFEKMVEDQITYIKY